MSAAETLADDGKSNRFCNLCGAALPETASALQHWCSDCTRASLKGWPAALALAIALVVLNFFLKGCSPASAVSALVLVGLVAASQVDWNLKLLPDDITQPLLWGLVLASVLGWAPHDAHGTVIGAMLGYLLVWLVHTCTALATGGKRQGLGLGDAKLLALLTAWLGVPALGPLVILSAAMAQVLIWLSRCRDELPFGPALAAAGIVLYFVPPHLQVLPLRTLGL